MKCFAPSFAEKQKVKLTSFTLALLVFPIGLLLPGGLIAPAHAQNVTFAGVQTTISASGLSFPTGVAVDGAGDVFIADNANSQVVEVPANGGAQTTVGSGLGNPSGVAVDQAGDVFIADTGNGQVVEVPAGGGTQTTVGSGLIFPVAVAVDGAGDVFIADSYLNQVVKVPAGGGAQTTVGSGLSSPTGVALDAAGDVFIADFGNNRVVEVPAGGGAQSTVGTGLKNPQGVAVDGAGNVFIADEVGKGGRVLEVSTSGTQTKVGSGLNGPEGLAVDGLGDVFIADTDNNRAVELQRFALNFGNINVCPAGQNSPPPCSQSITLTYNVGVATTFGATRVLTQGAPTLDFQLGSGGSTCTGKVLKGKTCTVNVIFAPLAPGARVGAVQLINSASKVVATTALYGIGRGPAVAFGPSNQATVPASGLDMPRGVAVDGAGDIFIADSMNNQVVEVPSGGGSQTTVGSGLDDPQGVAVDGAGNVFIADSKHNRVVRVPAGGGAQTTVGSGLSNPTSVAVDGAGDVFIADSSNNRVVKVPVVSGSQTTVGSGLDDPTGVAVDGAGDVFIADSNNNRVVKVPSVGAQTTVAVSGLSSPTGVAVDGAGDVFIVDSGNDQVVEVPAGGGSQTTVGSGLNNPFGLALDGTGDVFVADSNNNQVVEFERSVAPSLNFPLGIVGLDSTPMSVSIENIGNQPLDAVTPGLVVGGPNYGQVPGSGTPPDCTSSFALAPGASCNLSISFEPQTVGTLTSTATFTDNALNNASIAQTVQLSGIAKYATTVVWSNPAPINYGTALSSIQLDASATPVSAGTYVYNPPLGTILNAGTQTLSVTFTPSDPDYAPSNGSVTLQVNPAPTTVVWSNPAAITYGTPLNSTQLDASATPVSAGTYVYNPPAGTILNAGSQTLSVTFTPSNTNYAPSNGSVTLQVNPAPTTVVWSNPAPITYGTPLSSTQLDASATPVSAGTYVYNPPAGTILNAGNQTLSVAFTPSNTNYAPSNGSVTLQVTQASQTITFTQNAPASAAFNSSFTVAANASSGLPVTFTSAGVCSNVGATYTITSGTGTCTVKANQSGNSNYLAAPQVTQTTTAVKATPVITWATPAPITYGTALSATQLDATANVAGTFVYSPVSGTVEPAGTQTLSVTFTPTDHTDYSTATDSVPLVVNQEGTSTAITANTPNPSKAGGKVTIKFTVTPLNGGKLSGSVTVNASTGESCSGTVAAVAGTGTCSITFGTDGVRTVTATYPGDSNNTGSVSAPVTQTVNN